MSIFKEEEEDDDDDEKREMSESELRSEDSLQTVKYLGKVFSPYARGIGIATVST